MAASAGDGLRAGSRVIARGDHWSVAGRTRHADCESVRLVGVSPRNVSAALTLLLPFDRLQLHHERHSARVVSPRRWSAAVLRAAASAVPFGALASAAGGRIDLLPFQLEPALAMLRHGHARVLIADEVGLGKTIQAGLVLNELARRDDGFRALVAMPAGLREQWRLELRDRFALDSVVADAGWLAATTRDLPPDVNPWSLPGIYLASLDLVKRPEVLRAIEDVTWDLFVLDEAHAAGAATARLAAARALGARARRVLLLTATPPDGDPGQSAAMGAIGELGDEGPLLEFRRTRRDAGFGGARRTVLLQVRLTPAERRMHRLLDRYTQMVWTEAGLRRDARARLASAVLRKRALSSASSLAASVNRRAALLDSAQPAAPESQMLLPLGDEDPLEDDVSDAVLGAAGLADTARERELLRGIESAARAAAAARESKLAFLIRFVKRADEPAIVFTEYRDTLLHLEVALRGAGFDPLLLHGGMAPRERMGVQRAFNDRGSLLLATDAASEGLNLHARCRLVVHFELPWTPARLEQRTGRVDRLGQSRTVHEVLLVARHTAERMVLAPLVRRARTARRRTDARRGALAALTESRVTQSIMDACPLTIGDDDDRRAPSGLDLRDEASREARRIASARHSPSAKATGGRPVISSRRQPSPATAVTLLYSVSLEDGLGRVVHSELVPVRIHLHDVVALRRARDLRDWVSRFDSAHGQAGRTAAGDAAAESVMAATVQHAAVRDSLRRRESGLARQLPSAAQRLVQAGLFDSRALRHAESRQRTTTLLAEESEERTSDIAASAGVVSRTELVAVRFEGRRRS